MGNLKSDTFICLDCEATGLSTETDEIIELAVVKFRFDENTESFDTLVDPKRAIPPESTEVHKITDDMVIGKPIIADVLPKAFEMIGSHIIVGHNIGYDLNMLISAAKRCNIPCPIKLEHSIDTLRLARLYGESPSNSLETLRKHFNIEEEGAHRALNDVIVNIKVFKRLCLNFQRTEEVMKRLKEPIAMARMPLGKHRGLPFKEIPIDYLNWASHQDFDQDLLYSINKEKHRRRKRKQFSHNPFADL